ncbi:ATP-binding cassette transporter [Penicillium malachiteum]|nr:ATP-binding cassette transporter [Penicillium malachiteum]
MLVTESIHKRDLLSANYQRKSSKESTYSFWGKSMFLWTLALFPDRLFQGLSHRTYPGKDEMQRAWAARKGPYRLMKSVFFAYRWTLMFGVVPRVCLGVFTFCQPFLINATVNYMNGDNRPTLSNAVRDSLELMFWFTWV